MRKNGLFKKPLAVLMAALMSTSLLSTPTVMNVNAAKKAKNTVVAASTSVKPTKSNKITVTKAKKGTKLTVSVSGSAKKYVTVKLGKKTIVNKGKTVNKYKNKPLKQTTGAINLTATTTSKANGKKYVVAVKFGKKTVKSKTVTVKYPVTSIKLAKTASVAVGKTTTLKATVGPKNATFKTVKWSTSNKKNCYCKL
jgi:phosphotransferase system HPr-like phosphotransfer protein